MLIYPHRIFIFMKTKEKIMDFKQTLTQRIVLCEESNNVMSYNGRVHVVLDDFFLVELGFKADYRTDWDDDEYEDGYLSYQGSEWVVVEKVSGLEVLSVYNNEWGDELPLDCYVLTEDDEEVIKEIIADELCEIPAEVKFTKHYFEQTLSILAKPMSFPDLGGEGYLDLVVMDDDNTISEVTVYIDRDIEFNTLSIGNIVQQCCLSVEGLELEKEIVKLKEKVLDLMDLNDVYSSYVDELSNVLGQYEPTDYNY